MKVGNELPVRLGSMDLPGAAMEADVEFPAWKRMLDLVLVVGTLPIWFSVMVAITVWIKLVSPGPVFYRQQRVGFGGRRFMIYKFRSMKVHAETRTHECYTQSLIKSDQPMIKLDQKDSRLIPGARCLRALGLDELAQLINVLKGEMSLVGTRPSTPYEFEVFTHEDRARVNAPPGLTGLWQVSGKNHTTFSTMISLDVRYTRTMSVWLDLQIIAKTPFVLLNQLSECRSTAERDAQPARTNVMAPAYSSGKSS